MQGQTHTWPKYIHPVVRNFFSVRSGVEEFPLFGKLRAWRDSQLHFFTTECFSQQNLLGNERLGGCHMCESVSSCLCAVQNFKELEHKICPFSKNVQNSVQVQITFHLRSTIRSKGFHKPFKLLRMENALVHKAFV